MSVSNIGMAANLKMLQHALTMQRQMATANLTPEMVQTVASMDPNRGQNLDVRV